MRIVKSIAGMQRLAQNWQNSGRKAALVPTMGYLHAGHLSLVKRARALVGAQGVVVLSIYVNPTQFGPKEDFARYPRDLARDARLCREGGVNFIFAPTDAEMYPGRAEGRYSTFVTEESLGRSMEGAARPTHFRGVTTVVAKLFNIVLPKVAIFGAKDYQQAAILRRMTTDLNFPVKIVVAPTVREQDGVAMSSRNKYLEGPLRPQATALRECLNLLQREVRKTTAPLSPAKLKAGAKRLIAQSPDARLDYLEFFDPATLEPAKTVRAGTHVALAVFIGKTRLIDNLRLG